MGRRCIRMDVTDGPNIVALYQEGLSLAWIARYTGRHDGSIIVYLQRCGEWSREKAPVIDTARAIQQLRLGYSQVAVAARLGCSVDGLRRAVRAADYPRQQTDLTEAERENIQALYRAGVPWRRIVAETGRGYGSVVKALAGEPRRGWPRGRSREHIWSRQRRREREMFEAARAARSNQGD